MLALVTFLALVVVLGVYGAWLIKRASRVLRERWAGRVGRVALNDGPTISAARAAVGLVCGVLLLVLAGTSLLVAFVLANQLQLLRYRGSSVQSIVNGTFEFLFEQEGVPVGWSLVFGAFVWIGRVLWVKWRKTEGCCPRCLYSREGLTDGASCPECGLSVLEMNRVVRRRKDRWVWIGALGCLTAAWVIDRVVVLQRHGWVAVVPTTVMIPLRNHLPQSFIVSNALGPSRALSGRGRTMWQWQENWLKSELWEDVQDSMSLPTVTRSVKVLRDLDREFFSIDERVGTRERLIRWCLDSYGRQIETQRDAVELLRCVIYPIHDCSHLAGEYLDEVETMLRSGRDLDMRVGASVLRMFSRDPRALNVLEDVLGDHALASSIPGGRTSSWDMSAGRADVLRVAIRWPSDEDVQRIVPGSLIQDFDSRLVSGNESLLERLHQSQFVNGNSLMRKQYLAWIGEWKLAQNKLIYLFAQIADDEVEVLADGFLYTSSGRSASTGDSGESQRALRDLERAIWAEYVKRPACRVGLSTRCIRYSGEDFMIGQECLRENPAIEEAVREELESGKSDRVEAALAVLSRIWEKGQTDLVVWRLLLESISASSTHSPASNSLLDGLLRDIRQAELVRSNPPPIEVKAGTDAPVDDPK